MKARGLMERLALAVFAVSAVSCGNDNNGITDPTPTPGEKAGVVVMDSVQMRLVSDSASQAAGTYSFIAQGQAVSVKPNDIIVGGQGEGFLRRASTVTRRGDTLVVETTTASLVEAVEEGSYSDSTALFDETSEAAGLAGSNLNATEVVTVAPGVKATAAGLSLAGLTLYNQDGLSITIEDGFVSFNPSVTKGINIERKLAVVPTLKEFHAIADGTLVFDADVAATATKAFTRSGEVPLGTFEKSFRFRIGPVPVVGSVALSFKATWELVATASATLRGGVNDTSKVRVGVRYENSSWEKLTTESTEVHGRGPTGTASTELFIKVGVKPELELKLYGYPVTSSNVFPYLAYDETFTLPSTCVKKELFSAIDFHVQANVGILDPLVDKFLPPDVHGDHRVLYSDDSPSCKAGLEGAIAYMTVFNGQRFTEVINADGTGRTRLGYVDNSTRVSPPGKLSWSPDGSRIAFQNIDAAFFNRIYTMKADGTDVQQITNSEFDEISPAWSPDGRKIAFERLEKLDCVACNYTSVIWTKDLATGVETRRTPLTQRINGTLTNFSANYPSWAPDSRRLVFSEDRTSEIGISEENGATLMVTSGNEPCSLTQFGCKVEDQAPAWSPDGRRIVFHRTHYWDRLRDSPVPSPKGEIWAIDPDGGNPKLLHADSDHGLMHPVWSPDGQKIAFEAHDAQSFDPAAIWIDDAAPSVRPASETSIKLTQLGNFRPAWGSVNLGIPVPPAPPAPTATPCPCGNSDGIAPPLFHNNCGSNCTA